MSGTSASPTTLEVTQVRQALQHAVAAGAYSPYFTAICPALAVQILFTEQSVAHPVDVIFAAFGTDVRKAFESALSAV